MLLETERLSLREMTQADYPSLCRILQDEQVMYAYEGAFSDAEIQEWLDRQISRYQKWQFGLWAVILKETGELIGQCGHIYAAIPFDPGVRYRHSIANGDPLRSGVGIADD